jgi:hypothetical protein
MVGKYVTNVERSIKMKRDELKLIYKLVDDYADIVFNDVEDHDKQTTIDLVYALKILKRDIGDIGDE